MQNQERSHCHLILSKVINSQGSSVGSAQAVASRSESAETLRCQVRPGSVSRWPQPAVMSAAQHSALLRPSHHFAVSPSTAHRPALHSAPLSTAPRSALHSAPPCSPQRLAPLSAASPRSPQRLASLSTAPRPASLSTAPRPALHSASLCSPQRLASLSTAPRLALHGASVRGDTQYWRVDLSQGAERGRRAITAEATSGGRRREKRPTGAARSRPSGTRRL